jgi:hypothetical protein
MAAQARGDARAAVQSGKPIARPALAAPSRGALSSPREAAPRGSAREPASAQRGFAAPQASHAARHGSRPATVQRGRHFTAIPYARPPAQPQLGLRHTAMASCVTRGGRRSCTGGVRTASFRWGGDLAPAAMTQASCPDGTIATMAIGHDDIVRCVPL